MSDATSPVDYVKPVVSPDQELKKLEDSLAANQRDAERLKAEIADQKKIAGEVDQKVKDFAKVFGDIKDKKKALDDFVTREKKGLEETVDEACIQKLKDAAVKELDDLQAKITTALSTVRPAEKALEAAKFVTVDTQTKLSNLTRIPGDNAAILKDAASLVEKANAEGKANKFSRMYFLVLVLEHRLTKLNGISDTEYQKQVNEAAAELTKAENDERKAKAALDAANAAIKDAQKNLDAKKATWVDETLQKVAKCDAAPAKPATSPTTTTTTTGSEAAQPA